MYTEYFNTRAAAEAWAAEVGGTVERAQDGSNQWIVTWGKSATVARWTRKTGWVEVTA